MGTTSLLLHAHKNAFSKPYPHMIDNNTPRSKTILPLQLSNKVRTSTHNKQEYHYDTREHLSTLTS